MYERLPDGTTLRLRPIRPSDKPQLVSGLARLSDASAHRRFLSPKRRFSKAELRYLTEVDGRDHVAYVVEPAGVVHDVIAVGRWIRLPEDVEAAEVAIVVADEWQGRGVGSLLGAVLVDEARLRGVRRFTATILSDNRPALRLMQKVSDHFDRRHDGAGASEVVVELAA